MAVAAAWPRFLQFLCLCLLALTAEVQAQQCVDSNETDSGGDPCSYYDEHPHHCGCCDTSSFSASGCCACQDAALDGSSSSSGNASWWTSVFLAWPRKATAMRLSGKGVQAAFPPEVAQRWPQLLEIDLSHNQLTGTLPRELANLVNLSHLDLSDNQLSGPVPTEFGQLTRLQLLDLSANQLQGGLSAELGKLTSLRFLHLQGNQLSGSLPPELGELSSLEYLQMQENDFSGSLPRELGQLGSLRRLYLQGNRFEGSIPPEWGSLGSLEHLFIYSNQLSGSLPPQLGNMGSLTRLYAYSNALVGSLPAELGNLNSLQRLYLYNNRLSGHIPAALARMTNLLEIQLQNNQLVGPLPPQLGGLGKLLKLYVYGNELSGDLPRELGNLTKMTRLRAYSNRFTGSLPRELGNLKKLREISLYTNFLTGSLPEELSEMTSLQDIKLSDNQLAGSLPASLGKLPNLRRLSFRNNRLTGSLPPELGNLKKLELLNVRINRMSGHLPPQLGNCTKLDQLQLHDNQFTGSIPPEWGQLSRLRVLYLQENQLNTNLPPELGQLGSLQAFQVYRNHLHGVLPPEFGNLENLQYLDLFDCGGLSGPLPPELGKLSKLLRLAVDRNQLSGVIPAEFGQLAALQQLWLDGNRLTGHVPPELGKLVNLQELHLHGNQLNGSLPPELGNLVSLQELTLEDNNGLSGPLPASFGQLRELRKFSASGNPLLCGGGEVLQELRSLTVLNLRGCCFEDDIPELPGNLTYLDLGENRLSKVPTLWQTQNLPHLKTFLIDGNRIAHWDTSAVVPRTSFWQNSWLCGFQPEGQRFLWPLLERLDVSRNPLNSPAYEFLESLSHLTSLSVLQARHTNLTGEVSLIYSDRLVPGAPHTGTRTCAGFPHPSTAWVSFPALLTLDLAGNNITGMPAAPPSGAVQADLSWNALTTLHPLWLQGGQYGALQRVDAQRNPKLKLPVLLKADSACPAQGASEPTANAQGWGAMEDGRTECTSLCPMKNTRLLLDATTNESVLCRCAQGQGTGLNCSSCPDDTYSTLSFEDGQFRRSCLACPANSQLSSSSLQGVCFADCSCAAGYHMVQLVDGGSQDVGTTPCGKLASQGRCESCGIFKTSPAGSRKASDCFCNSDESQGGWADLLEREGRCGCPEGFHMDFADRSCVRCMPEEDCEDWTRSLEPPRVREGFWAQPPAPRGDGTYGNFSRHSIWVCRSTAACPGNSTCGENRVGVACSLCARGHFSTPSGSCASCPRSYTSARRMLAGLMLGCIVFPLLAQTALTADTHSRGLMMTLRSLRTSLRQVVKFAQVLGLVSLFRVEWPPLVDSIFAVFRAFSLDFASWTGVACLAPEQQQTMTLEMGFRWMLPVAGIAVTCLAALLVTACGLVVGPVVARCRPQREAKVKQLLSFPPLDVLRVLLFFLYLLFPSLLKNTLLPLTCSPSPNGLLTMNAFPHITCWSSESNTEDGNEDGGEDFWSVAMAGLAQSATLVVGLPLLLFFAWRRIAQADTPDQRNKRLRWWSFVFEDFRPHKASWALVVVSKDIALNLVVVLLPGLGTAQLLLTSIISVVYACRSFCTAPYRDMSNNLLEICTSGAIATLCLFSAGMGFQSEPDLPDLGEHIEGGRDGSGYFVRAISLVCLQGLSLAGPALILSFQVLMAFERCRRHIPSCLQPMSEEQREEWSQLFAATMGLEGSALPRALTEMDNFDFSIFQRSVRTAPTARDSLRMGTSSFSLGSGSLDSTSFRQSPPEEVAALVPELRKENKSLRAEIAELHAENAALCKCVTGAGLQAAVKAHKLEKDRTRNLEKDKAHNFEKDEEVDRPGTPASADFSL